MLKDCTNSYPIAIESKCVIEIAIENKSTAYLNNAEWV